MILEKQFREIVEERIEELGWSRSEFARRLGVGPQYVTNLLNGHDNPSVKKMESILNMLGYTARLEFKKISEPKKIKLGA